jgi:hypothetical protein
MQDSQKRSIQQLDNLKTEEDVRRREMILNWISPIRQWDRFEEVSSRTAGTGQWLLSNTQYLAWKNEEMSSIFWLRGKSTTLSSST